MPSKFAFVAGILRSPNLLWITGSCPPDGRFGTVPSPASGASCGPAAGNTKDFSEGSGGERSGWTAALTIGPEEDAETLELDVPAEAEAPPAGPRRAGAAEVAYPPLVATTVAVMVAARRTTTPT